MEIEKTIKELIETYASEDIDLSMRKRNNSLQIKLEDKDNQLIINMEVKRKN